MKSLIFCFCLLVSSVFAEQRVFIVSFWQIGSVSEKDTSGLQRLLDTGWKVVQATPVLYNSFTKQIVYILEK